MFESAGQIDSAIVYAERYYAAPRLGVRAYPEEFERLARLYERRRDNKNAIRYYQKFVDFWKNADAPLQSRVIAARERIAKLNAGASR